MKLSNLSFFFKNKSKSFSKNKSSYIKKAFKTLIYILLGFCLLVLAIDNNFLWLFGKSPGISDLRNPKFNIASELYTSDGRLLGKYYNENRDPINYEDISDNLKITLLATEDIRFYEHFGIDYKGTLAAAWATLKGERRGGSTITQQLVKNLFKMRRNYSTGLLGKIPFLRSIIYKLKEWITSVKIELFFDKNEILTMYFNSVEFGNNTYGIKTASKTYFDKLPSELTIEECALLIGMLKAPSTYNPVTNKKAALKRRNVVLGQLKKYNFIDEQTYDSLIKIPIKLKFSIEPEWTGNNGYIRDIVAKELNEWLKKNNYDLYSDGLIIYTTIDSTMQDIAEESVLKHMKNLQNIFNAHWGNQNPWIDENHREIEGFVDKVIQNTKIYKIYEKKYNGNLDSIRYYLNLPHKMNVFTWDKKGEKEVFISSYDSLKYYLKFLRCGFITMDPHTGYIKSWIGGINYKYFKFDHIKQLKRQPGSTFKAFVYATAIEKGMSPCDKLPDVVTTIEYIENGEKKKWTPRNADWIHTGVNVTLKHGFALSLNTITAQIIKKFGWQDVIKMAHRLGIKSKLTEFPSVCLGASDVSLYELVTAYCPLVNGGYRVKPQIVQRIEDKDGNILYEAKPIKLKVLSDETAFMMTQLFIASMKEPGGTSQALWEWDLFRYNTDIGGKTGTSSNYSDGWFIGVTPRLIGGVWVGAEHRAIHFRTSELGEGCRTALPIFGLFLEKVFKNPKFDYLKTQFPKFNGTTNKSYNCGPTFTKRDSIRKSMKDTLLKSETEIPL